MILGDLRIFKRKEELEFSIDRINKIFRKKMFTNEKAEQTFLQHLIVHVWQLVKSFEVVIIQVLYVENTCTCRFQLNL